jgi:hypothetical protein
MPRLGNLFFILIAVLSFISAFATYMVRRYNLGILFPDYNLEQPASIDLSYKPINFDAKRRLLTALYRERHTGDCNYRRDGIDTCVHIDPKLIVIHMTGIDDFDGSFNTMKDAELSENRTELINKGDFMLNVSAHYLVDREGKVFSLMPDNIMARHAMGLNHISIGIENVGTGKATAAQIESNVKLVSYLMRRYGIKRIVSHTEVEKLRDAKDPLYVEKVSEFFRHKECGDNITDQVRKRLGL